MKTNLYIFKNYLLVLLFTLVSVFGWGQTTESFNNLPTTSSTNYLNRTWTGDNGGVWNATGARTDQTLTGKCITVNSTSTVTSNVVSGGMGTLTFNYVRAFTGTGVRSFTVWVNGTQIGGITNVSTTSNTVVQYSATINISGNVQLEIRTPSTSNQIKFDDINWTSYSSSTPNLSAGSLTAFGNVCTNTTTSANSFTITGTNLDTSNVDVAALTGFSYSTTLAGTYTSTLSITQSGGSFSQQVFVKFNPTLVQSYNGNIAVSGGGASSINVAASGSGINTSPTVDTPTVSGITSNSATLGGNISNIGCSNATTRGIEWSTTNGFANGSGTQVSSSGSFGTGTFTNSVTGLPPGTVIYFKAFATNSGGTSYSAQSSFTTACNTFSYPFTETFETSSTSISCWSQYQVTGAGSWTYATGSSGGAITTANSGTRNARFVSVSGTNSPITKLISPNIDLSSAVNPVLEFYYGQEFWSPDQNELKVYYSNDGGTSWILLKTYTDNVNTWTKDEILLPNPTANYKIAFEGINNFGRANVIDDVAIKEASPKVSFSVTTATVNENSTTYSITVNSNIIGSNTVEIAATGGTATNGNQYTFATTTATFTSSTTFTTNVTINNNTTCSGNTDVIFSLQNPSSGCTIGANNQLTLSITDDEYFSGNIKALQFETGDNWSYTGTGALNTTASKYYGTQSYRIGGVGNLETDNVSIVGYNNVTLKVAFAATGVDSGDDLFLDISYDNGSNWSSTKLVDGFSDANINIGNTSASNPTTVATNPWVVNIPSTETQIKVRLRTTTNSATEYYWVDDIVLSGQYCVSCAEPTTNSTFHVNSPQNITTNSVTLNWTPGNGSNRIVILKEDSAVTFVPADNTTYQSNANFGSGTDLGGGQFVVYNGSAGTANVSGLTPGKVYYAAIYDYGCLSGTENYLTSNPGTDFFVVTPENPLNFQKICATNTSLELSWEAPTNGVFDGYIITVRQGASPSNVNTIDPSTVITANPDISLAQNYGTSSYFVYKGNANSVNITGLTTGTSYTFKIYAYTDAGSVYEYSSGTQTTQSVTIPDITSAISFNGDASATISWTNPSATCYDDVMAVVTTAAGITFTPSGNAYTPNSVYSSPNQVVFKDNANTLTVTGLTNGVTYYVEIFVRKGLQWSSGVEVAVTPNAVTGTTLQAGDFAIVAINTSAAASSSEDEITFVCFKDITEGTQIYLTDNGFERKFANKWGNSEGIISLVRTNSTLAKGTFVTIRTTNGGVKVGSDFKVYVCGSEDTNWTKDEISSGTFDLNKDDQVWFMQGGIWTNITTGNHDATYNGNILYGWTDIAWKTTPAWDLANGTKGSTIPSGFKCFTTDVSNPETGASRVQFNYSAYSSVVTNDQLEWIALMNNTANWAYYTSNANYYGSPNYTIYNSCSAITIASDTHTNGKWNGTQDVNWFNCSNWDTLKVPDQNTNVTFNSTVTNNANIDATATDSDFYGDIAKVNNIIIDKSLTIEGSVNNKLEVYGNLTLNAGGTLDMDDGNTATQDGQIYLYNGNWTNNAGEANFLQGQSTVHFLGSTPQIINANNHANYEKFGNVVMGNNFDTSVSNNLFMDGYFTLNTNKTLNIASNDFVDIAGVFSNYGALTVQNDGNLVQREGSTYTSNNQNVSVYRNALMKRLDYNYWGAPVAAQQLKAFSPATVSSRFYEYHESDDLFYSVSWLTNFVPGKGFAIRAPNNYTTAYQTFNGAFAGVLNNGNVTQSLSYTTTLSATHAEAGYNLIANPYASNIDFDELFNDNSTLINRIAYFWTNTNVNPPQQGSYYTQENYAVYNGSGGTPSTHASTGTFGTSSIPINIIKVGQGFMVSAKQAGTLTIKNRIRTSSINGNFFNVKTAPKDRYWLELITPVNNVNTILLAYVNGATNGFDGDYDAKLLTSASDEFYSYIAPENTSTIDKLVIQGKEAPLNIDDKVLLGANFFENGNYTIKLANKEGIFGDVQPIFLHDKLLNIYTDLQKDTYTFAATLGENNSRFEIIYNPLNALSTDDIKDKGFAIYKENKGYRIISAENMKSIEMYDASGKLINKIESNSKNHFIEYKNAYKGVYILKINTADKMYSGKIIF